MGKWVDIAGKRVGRLLVSSCVGRNKNGQSIWLCQCDCGKEKTVMIGHLNSGSILSCGCLRSEKSSKRHLKHGQNKRSDLATPTYRSWHNMKQRCLNTKNTHYSEYGDRGIKVCERWMRFENFYADMGDCPEGLTIDRINNDGNYEPGNCRWTTVFRQHRNQRSNKWLSWNGISKIEKDWATEWGIKRQAIGYLLKKGHSMEWIYINKVEPKLSPSTVQARMMLVA